MILENKAFYKQLLIHKIESEHIEIIIESDTDQKLLNLILEDYKTKKQKKKLKMETLMYIVFGQQQINELLEKGFKSY